jgi:hypothetical protein
LGSRGRIFLHTTSMDDSKTVLLRCNNSFSSNLLILMSRCHARWKEWAAWTQCVIFTIPVHVSNEFLFNSSC